VRARDARDLGPAGEELGRATLVGLDMRGRVRCDRAVGRAERGDAYDADRWSTRAFAAMTAAITSGQAAAALSEKKRTGPGYANRRAGGTRAATWLACPNAWPRRAQAVPRERIAASNRYANNRMRSP